MKVGHVLALRNVRWCSASNMRMLRRCKLLAAKKEIAILREEYPEDSLKELGEKTNPPIGKSGVNHRLSRLVELAETI